jgi:hypothetical protein
MTKFLIDENVPPTIADLLRTEGFDVKHAQEYGLLGRSDSEIIGIARGENRILVTFDRHIANILLYPPNSHHGIIRIHIHPPLIPDIIQALEHFIRNFDLDKINKTLVVLERKGFRVRRMY